MKCFSVGYLNRTENWIERAAIGNFVVVSVCFFGPGEKIWGLRRVGSLRGLF